MQRKNTKGRPWRQGELERTDDTCMEQGPFKTAWGGLEIPCLGKDRDLRSSGMYAPCH